MRVLFFDLETTGTDVTKDRATEVGAVLWDVPTKTPLVTMGAFLHEPGFPALSDEIQKLTGIQQWMLAEFGLPGKQVFSELDRFATRHRAEYLVGHNSENFDRPLLYAELSKAGGDYPTLRGLPWLDTLSDLPWEEEPKSKRLGHLAYDLGFLNPFSHRAIFDCLTTAKIFSHFPIESILEYQRIPWVICRAVVSFADKDKAKAQRFSWEKIGTETFPKFWVKKLKLNQFDAEVAQAKKNGFDVIRLT